MQVKTLAAAVAAMGAVAVNAAPLDPTTQAPDVTVYIAGASAQANAIANVLPSAVCATPADVVQINGSLSTGPDLLGLTVKVASQAWYCMSIPSLTGNVSKKLLVIYNNTNGSAAGLRQLIDPTNFTTIENLNLSIPSSCTGVTAGTVATPDGTLTMPNYVCNSLSMYGAADMALADVAPTEFAAGIVPNGPNTITTKKTGLEGFGVMVNARLYSALQTQNIADGLLPSSCAGDNTTAACMPSIRSADYAAVANQNNALTTTYASLLPSIATPAGDGTLKLCRRDIYSGSQASSNIFFLNNVCGAIGYKGGLPDARVTDSTTNFLVAENTTGGAVTSCIAGAAGYALGVASTGTGEGASSTDGSKTYRFVKIDGVTPLDGAKNRTTMIRGDYKFAVDMTASYKKTVATSSASIKVANAIINTMLKTSASDLAGIGYEDPAGTYGDGKTAKYTHGGNNCSPLH